MKGDRRVWWGTGAVLVGLGVALLSGTGTASADTGSGRQHSTTAAADTSAGTSSTTSSATSSTSSAATKHRAAPAASVSGARTPRLTAVVSVIQPAANDTAASGTGASPLKVVVSRIVAASTAASQALATTDVTTPAITTAAAVDATANPAPATEVAQHIAAIRSLAAPVANAPPTPGRVVTVVLNLLSGLGWQPNTAAVQTPPVTASVQTTAAATSGSTTAQALLSEPSTGVVTGVKVGHSDLQIPVGPRGYTTKADWYFPTQADGTVHANGVIWLQHGFLANKSYYSALATQLAQQTNSIVVVPNIASFALRCPGCSLSGVQMQQAVASMFAAPGRPDLNSSADAAGYSGTLPDAFTLTGHSAGGGFAVAAAGFYTADVAPANNTLLGVVMFDGVASSTSTFATALASLDTAHIPVYQIAAPPQIWNAFATTTNELVALRPNQFDGVVLVGGSHVDSMLGSNPIVDFAAQLVTKFSPPGNTQAVYTLASGWINDFYAGNTPTSPGPKYGIYGSPDQYIKMGQTAAVVLGPPPVVDVSQYSGTW